jgi:hypothetical protein
MKQIQLRFTVLIFSALVVITGCKKDEDTTPVSDFGSAVPISYFSLALKLTKETAGFTPPVAARAYGYTGVTLYEAVVAGMKDYQSLEGQVNGLAVGDVPSIEDGKAYQWELVANAALAGILRNLYKTTSAANLAAIDSLENLHFEALSAGVSEDVAERSKAHGQAVAAAMYEYGQSDNQDECYLKNFPADYVPPVGNGYWVPTAAGQKALQPYWGSVRPFLTADVSGTQPSGHPVFSTVPASEFFAEALDVYNTTTALTDEQKIIANFWSDDPGKTSTPPGHSISVLSQVLDNEDANLALAAEAYAKVGMAVHDAFISCWKCKYDFSLMRPVTFIKENIDSTWTTLLSTPPFPEYTSGHSVQSGASAQVMTDLFGANYAFTDKTHEARTDIDGTPRSFDSFFEMAEEAAISRLYGGIHYKAAIDDGLEQGKKIGLNIGALRFKK